MPRDLRLIFNANREIECVFFTLIVKTEALNKNYPGGAKAFAEKHEAKFNRSLLVLYAMAMGYHAEAAEELYNSGLVHGEDYIVFDPTSNAMLCEEGSEVTLGVDWLRGYIKGHGMMVRYTGD